MNVNTDPVASFIYFCRINELHPEDPVQLPKYRRVSNYFPKRYNQRIDGELTLKASGRIFLIISKGGEEKFFALSLMVFVQKFLFDDVNKFPF